ncbi:MAG: hypothetical protein JWP43_1800 [Ramlibacter sp.]|jgi:hypothetical protein|nr:hypothetical protein [Ramlibacter sp.]
MSDAADKLARTRLAIVEHIHRRERHPERRENLDSEDEAQHEGAGRSWARSGPASWFTGLKRAAGGWWQQHPARFALELATPALSDYAGRKPVQFLAIAAAVGAVAVVARPWRLISATGLLMAVLKSSQLSGLVMSAMSASDEPGEPRR